MDEIKIRLKPPMLEFVNQLLAAGRHDSLDEIFWEALGLLREHEEVRRLRVEDLRKAIAVGIEQLDRGESAPLDMEEIKRLGRELLAQESGEQNGTGSPLSASESRPG